MIQRPSILVSDAHLGAVPLAAQKAFGEFLESVPDLSDDLIINGDLFDFWFEYRRVILREHFRVLCRLAELVDGGVRIRLVGGNHDAWGGSFLSEEIGIELVRGPCHIQLGGRRAYLAHGDGLAGGDWGYRVLKRTIRSQVGSALFRLIHPDLGRPIASLFSATAARELRGPGVKSARAIALSEHAAQLLRSDPTLDLVVFGHTHWPELSEVEPGRYYLNPGDWVHHFTYGVVSPSEVLLKRWTLD